MKYQKTAFLKFKKIGLIFLCFPLFLFIILSCSDLPVSPYSPSNAKMTVVLESSDKQQNENLIHDSIGHTIRIGFICFMPKFIDSINLKIISNFGVIEKDTVFKILSSSTGYDTIWYDKSFYYAALRTVQITTFIEDGKKISETAAISIEGPPNQKPTIHVIGSLNPAPNSPCTLFVNGIDGDNFQLLSYSADDMPPNSKFVKQMFTWTPSVTDIGVFPVTFRVTDNGYPPLYDSTIMKIVVDLSLPKPSKPLNLAVVERKAVTVSLKWLKSERAESYQLFGSTSKTTSYSLRKSVLDTVVTDTVGSAAFYYYVNAKNRTGDISSDTILVSSINSLKPIWTTDSFSVDISEGLTYSLSLPLQCKMPGSDSLTFKLLDGIPSGDTITTQKLYTYSPSFTDSGYYKISLVAQSNSLIDTFTLKMHVVNVNRSPVFLQGLPKLNRFVLEKDTLQIPYSTVDPDGDVVSYTVKGTNLPRQGKLEHSKIDGILKWISLAGDSGVYIVDLIANDGVDSTVVTINVVVGKGNVPPAWTKQSLSLSVKEALSCTLNLADLSNDPNGDSLTFSLLAGLPAGDAIVNNNLYIYSSTYDDSGTYDKIKIVASDGYLYDTVGATLKVLNVNRSPVISGVKDMTVGPSVAVKCTVVVSDPDNDPTTLSAPTLPAGATLDSLTGVFSFPSPVPGDNFVSFSATDGKLVTPKNIIITVSATPRPEITKQPASVSTCAGKSATFSIGASGTAPLSYSWRKNGTNISGQVSNTLVLSSVKSTDAGVFQCVVSNAGGYSTSDTAILAVTVPSVSPTSSGVTANPSSICLGSSTILNVTAGALGSGASSWKWYTDRACTTLVKGTFHKTIGGTIVRPITDGSQFVVIPAASGINKYFVRAEGVCNTTFDSVQVSVTSIPSKPATVSATPSTIFVGDSVVLKATSGVLLSKAKWYWYTESCGGTPVSSTTVYPQKSMTYYVRAENGTCYSACDSVVVTVQP